MTGRLPERPAVKITYLYIVYWPDRQVLKVGTTTRSDRLKRFTGTGAVVLATVRGATVRDEQEAQRYVGMAFDKAFAGPDASVAVLGPHGMGWTECFAVARHHRIGAVELALLGIRRSRGEAA